MKPLSFAVGVLLAAAALSAAENPGNRLTYLDGTDPFYPHRQMARLTTPQWIGEDGVEAVVILSIDDLRETAKYEAYLRPVLERLKKIDGRAPFSVMACKFAPEDPLFQKWLQEGVSLEVHTLTHPCPLLGKADFAAAEQTVHDGLDLLGRIPGNHPVAFRMPCCDSMNSPSPRFYAEIFPERSPEGRFLQIDSSIMNLITPQDEALPPEITHDAAGKERFRKYFPTEMIPPRKLTFERFGAYIEDYPYPYVIGRSCWEFPCAVPSDWEAFNCHGPVNPETTEDWKAALDAAVIKQGVMTMILHPHGWSSPEQIVALIDYATAKYGKRVKFLNFAEALERLQKNALAGQPLRAANGADNGVRLLDLDGDGYMDVLVGNAQVSITRRWDAKTKHWQESPMPARLVDVAATGARSEAPVKFGVTSADGAATMLSKSRGAAGAWRFTGGQWQSTPALLTGLEQVAFQTEKGATTPLSLPADGGIRLRDFDADGQCELLVSNPDKSEIYAWSEEEKRWKKTDYTLPLGVSLVDTEGRDNGLRFVDLNGDGLDDVLFSNADRFAIYLAAKKVKASLGWKQGWPHLVREGRRTGGPNEPPPIVRGGAHPNNGAWFRDGALFVENEDTSKLEAFVEEDTFKKLIAFDVPPPKSPEESLKSMFVHSGFTVELVAAEPMLESPIAFDWDARGRLWVVEMRDYPLGLDGKGKPGGVIKVLEDTKGDGHYDKVTVFMEGIGYPSSVMPWGKGALIGAAPELFYAEDTNGDGRADVKRVLYDGFIEGNPQHRFNGFEYGLDNWIYCANGDSGGKVRSLATGKTVDLRGHDIRFRPNTGDVDVVEGQTQFGRHCDDWGDWFGNYNSAWLWHYPIPERYLGRNPQLTVKSLKQPLANYPDSTRAFPISAPVIRFNDPAALGHVTSGNSPVPYRDDLFGPEFAHSVFASEPVHNVVHREVLEPDGVTFTSHRAEDEQTSEFLASSDNWFRPTMTKTGPDGALYVCDMYRFVLEHPEWIAPETQERLDLRAGADKGRIYRVVPIGKERRKIPNLGALDTRGLVAALDSPSGWQRTMAQRLLVERSDRAAEPLLNEVAVKCGNPKARLQALCTLDGLLETSGGIPAATLAAALRDAHPGVRREAVRLCEPLLKTNNGEILEALAPLAADPEIRVRYQLAYSLGESRDSRAGRMLAAIAARDGGDPFVRVAILSSAVPHVGALIEALLAQSPDARPVELLSELVALAASGSDATLLGRVLTALAGKDAAAPERWQFASAAGLLDTLQRRGQGLAKLRKNASPELAASLQVFGKFAANARGLVNAEHALAKPELVTAAIGMLGRDANEQANDIAALHPLLDARMPSAVQSAAVAAFGRMSGPEPATAMLAGWNAAGPALRQDMVTTLLTRKEWRVAVLDAVEKQQVAAGQLGTAGQQILLRDGDATVHARAAKLLQTTGSDRQKIVAKYLAVIPPQGDATRGHEVFRTICTVCHHLKGEGNEVGPELGMVVGKPVDYLLTAILDPNQAIESRYIAYLATLKDGRAFTGVIASETTNGITIKAPGGAEQTVLRSELKELVSLGRSLMPEGLEAAITPDQMADLIAFLRKP